VRQYAIHQMGGGVCHASRRAARTDSSSLAAERHNDLVVTALTAHAREAVREDAAAQIRGELALDVARQPAAVGVGVAQLGEQRLGVPGHQLVQHGSFRGAAPVPAERLSGRAGRPFVQAADEHVSAL
jgi:hypothetical protein